MAMIINFFMRAERGALGAWIMRKFRRVKTYTLAQTWDRPAGSP